MSGRRTHAQVAAQAVATERDEIVAFGRTHVAGLSRMVESGKVPADGAALLADRLTAFLDMIEQGLHEGINSNGQ